MRIMSLVFVLLACSAQAQGVRFPVNPAPVSPTPSPVSKLTANTLYVIDSDVPLIVLASPSHLVSVTEDAGPMKVKAWFVDGKGMESRTFKGKHLFFVEALASGTVELIIVPVGVTKSSDVIRKSLEVDAGKGPQPPPGPDPGPQPPIDDPLAKAITLAWQQEFDANKKELAEKMAQCYDAGAQTTATAKAWGDISGPIRNNAAKLGLEGKLPVVSKAISTQLVADGFPASPSVLLQPGDAEKASATLKKVSAILRNLP